MPKGTPGSSPTCSIECCERPYEAKGFCQFHYRRNKDGVDLLKPHKFELVGLQIDHMSEAIGSRSREDCWEWEWSTDSKGYGRVGMGGKKATHISLELAGNPRPEPPFDKALHKCDNKWCWNPAHLWWGSDQENQRDYADKWSIGKEAVDKHEKLIAWLDEHSISFPEEMR